MTKSPGKGNIIMLLFTAYFLIVNLIVLPCVSSVFQIKTNSLTSTAFILIVGVFLPFVFYVLFTRQKLTNILLLTPPKMKHIVFAITLGMVLVPITVTITMLGEHLNRLVFLQAEGESGYVSFGATASSFWALIVVSALFPAFLEEFWFRGVLFDQYYGHKNGVSVGKTAFITALFFCLVHDSFSKMLHALLLGLVLAYVLYYTRSIWIPILVHFVHNALSFSMAFLSPPEPAGDSSQTPNGEVTAILFFACVCLVMIPVIIICLKKFKKYRISAEQTAEGDSGSENIGKQRVFTWSFWVVVIVLVLFRVLRQFNVL